MDKHGLRVGEAGSVRTWLFALVPAAMLCVLLYRPIWDVDIFWQLKLGELILARHGPVPAEPFAARHLGEPLPAVAWMGQAIMAWVRLASGWTGLRVFDALCWLGGFWAVAVACWRRGASSEAIGLALALVFLCAFPTGSIRPQSFACLCLGLLLALHRLRLKPAVTIALGIPLLVVWQNLHPSVTVGAMVMGATAAAGWIGWLRNRERELPIAATVLALAGALAVFATPDGVSILAISARNAQASMAIGASEWLPLWAPANRSGLLPILTIVFVVAFLVRRAPSRIDGEEWAVALVLLALTITASRFVLFWSVAMVPVIARAVGPRILNRNAPIWLAPAGVAVAALTMPALVPTHFVATLPLAAIERLKQENVHGTVYGDFPFGGALIDAGYPRWRVAYDGRYYRYEGDEWRYNGGIENGLVPLVDVVRKWRPVAFVLDSQHNAPIAAELAKSHGWRRIWNRDGIVVYVPRRRR